MSHPKRLLLAATPFLLVLAALVGCTVNTGPKQLTCSASQVGGCNLECSGSDNCVAQCQSTTGGCTLTCTDSSTCTCEGNTCTLDCQTSGTCTCSASICACSGNNCKH